MKLKVAILIAVATSLAAVMILFFVSRPPSALVGLREYPPHIFTQNNQIGGVSAEIIKKLPLEKVQVQWTESTTLVKLLEKLEKKEIDVVTAVAPNNERKKFALFTKPYFTVGSKLFYVKPEPQVICVGERFAIEEWARKNLAGKTIVTEKTNYECVVRTLVGKSDAVAMDEVSVPLAIPTVVSKFFSSVDLGFTYDLAFAVNPDKPWLVDLINEQIDRSTSQISPR